MDDLKTIWDEEHDFEEEDLGDGVPEEAPAPAPAPEVVIATDAPKEGVELTADEIKAKELAATKAAGVAEAKAKVSSESGVLRTEVEVTHAEAVADAALADAPAAATPPAPAEAPTPALDPKNVLSSAFSSIVEDPAKIEGLKKVVEALGQEKLGADYASIPAPTDEFFKDSKNALLHNLLYIARFVETGKKPSEALAEGETLASDQNMDKAIALLKEKSETSEIKEDLQKLDLEAVKKALQDPSTTPETPDAPAEVASGGWAEEFFGKAASGIAKNLVDNVTEEQSGTNDWLNMGGMQNQLLLMVLKLCTYLAGKKWYLDMSEQEKTILEKRFGLIKQEDETLFKFDKPTDTDYMKTDEAETPAAPVETPAPATPETPATPAEGGQEKTPEIKNKDDALAAFLWKSYKMGSTAEGDGSTEPYFQSLKTLLLERYSTTAMEKKLTDAQISPDEVSQLKNLAVEWIGANAPQSVLAPYLKDYSFGELNTIVMAILTSDVDLTNYQGIVGKPQNALELISQKFKEALALAAEKAGNKDLATKVRALDLA